MVGCLAIFSLSFSGFESMFIKAGNSDTGRAEDRRRNRKEPRLGCFSSLGSPRKGGLGALASVSQWLEHWSTHQRLVGLIPSQEHIPWFGVWSPSLVRFVWEATHQCVSLTLMFLSLFPSPSLSLPPTLSEDKCKNILG
uniref:Uncharacterized protein n=1 Tax=Molossus molossus TaxID=27622 RepID=A0A7J8JX43_MOLMO|nr:hypothetical protein HJG59_007962 [Molossus molossus]